VLAYNRGRRKITADAAPQPLEPGTPEDETCTAFGTEIGSMGYTAKEVKSWTSP